MYVAGMQYILGIKPSYNSLIIIPMIPEKWPGFSAKRVFRGITYVINAQRIGPGHQSQILVDGQPIPGNVIPIPGDKQMVVQVSVKIGKETKQ